ncbi:acyltransferase [bacterium]|nr:MAG: acyltransferase [bacterium]
MRRVLGRGERHVSPAIPPIFGATNLPTGLIDIGAVADAGIDSRAETPASRAMKKFDAIESLRGYMAWWVVIGHAIQVAGVEKLIPYRLVSLLLHGDCAVQVFMIISGFVITHLLLSRDEPYGQYVSRRFFRLFPLYVAMIVISILSRHVYADVFGNNPWITDPQMRLDRLAAEENNWLAHAGLHLMLLHGVLPDTTLMFASSTFLAPAWSISLEWQFYLIAPLMVAAMAGTRHRWVIPMLVVASVPVLAGDLGDWRYQSFLLLTLPFFMLGIISRIALDGRPSWLAIGSTVVATGIYVALTPPGEIVWAGLVLAIWAVSLLAAVLENREISNGPLRAALSLLYLNPIAKSLGQISYSTYLCHIPIFTLVIGAGVSTFGPSHSTFIASTIVSMLLAIPASFALHRFIEMPGQKLRPGRSTRPRQESLSCTPQSADRA